MPIPAVEDGASFLPVRKTGSARIVDLDDDAATHSPFASSSGVDEFDNDVDSIMAVKDDSPVPGLDLADGTEDGEERFSDVDAESLYNVTMDD